MNRQDIIDYVTYTPYNINPIILGQKLDEWVQDEVSGTLQTNRPPKLVGIRREDDIDKDVVTDYYNENLHADGEEVIDFFFERKLFHRADSLGRTLYTAPSHFTINNDDDAVDVNFYERTHIADIPHTGLIRYLTPERAKEMIVGQMNGKNSKGHLVKKKLFVTNSKDGLCINYKTKQLVTAKEILENYVNGSLFSIREESGQTIVYYPALDLSQGRVIPSGQVAGVVRRELEAGFNKLIKEISEQESRPIFMISNSQNDFSSLPDDAVNQEKISQEQIILKFFEGKSYYKQDVYVSHPACFFISSNIESSDTRFWQLSVWKILDSTTTAKFLTNMAIRPNAPLILEAQNDNTTPTEYLQDATCGDIVIEGLKNNKQVFVRTPNADGGDTTAIYSPILTYQLPNQNNEFLYLFYLRDEKQDLSSVLGAPIQMPVYGELKLKLSNPYSRTPLE